MNLVEHKESTILQSKTAEAFSTLIKLHLALYKNLKIVITQNPPLFPLTATVRSCLKVYFNPQLVSLQVSFKLKWGPFIPFRKYPELKPLQIKFFNSMFETSSCPNKFLIDSWSNTDSTFVGGIVTGQMTIAQI